MRWCTRTADFHSVGGMSATWKVKDDGWLWVYIIYVKATIFLKKVEGRRKEKLNEKKSNINKSWENWIQVEAYIISFFLSLSRPFLVSIVEVCSMCLFPSEVIIWISYIDKPQNSTCQQNFAAWFFQQSKWQLVDEVVGNESNAFVF
jgi:hypothetical protein